MTTISLNRLCDKHAEEVVFDFFYPDIYIDEPNDFYRDSAIFRYYSIDEIKAGKGSGECRYSNTNGDYKVLIKFGKMFVTKN